MIFIAGVSPKIKVLDQNPRRCPVCGLNQAYYKRKDHYLCEQTAHASGPDFTRPPREGAHICISCGKALDKDFKYCPHCGKRI
jgi:rubrerythrin